jgi:dethiobiotin synthetase
MSVLMLVGTDVAVGTTWVSSALARAWTDLGLRVLALKPVETGCATDTPSVREDGVQLARATGQISPRHALCRLRAAGAAPLAAKQQRGELNYEAMVKVIGASQAEADVVLVDAGGLLSPITWPKTPLDLARDLGAQVVVCTADRAGMVNLSRLTVQALRAAEVPVAALVVSQTQAPAEGAGFSADLEALLHFEHLPQATGLPFLPSMAAAARALSPLARRLRP